MRTGRPKPELTLTIEERHTLEQWTRRPKTAQACPACPNRAGMRHRQPRRGCSVQDHGADGGALATALCRTATGRLLDEPRPGTPRRTSDAEVERLLRLTLETTPKAATHWSSRDMAHTCGLSQSTVSRIWRAFGLQPHRTETFKLSQDPLFIEKGRDVVGLYRNPPTKPWCLFVDENAQIQALDRTRPLLPMRPGQAEQRTHDY